MEPVFLDLHIHTSENPSNLNTDYSVETLASKIEEYTGNSQYLISLTDHNTINKSAYLNAKDRIQNILIGVELHIKNYDAAPPYHCHIYFNTELEEYVIDELNRILDELYPTKVISKTDRDIPQIQDIINGFDLYDFLLLPHGGQSHSTFDKSIPEGVKFDSTMERSIYYNQFDGFTARGNTGLERTKAYFEKLGIFEFVNLVTCTDNYIPENYPNAKSADANPFIPTWMLALPTFNGLRLSLSESSRLIYANEKPTTWSEHIKGAKLIRDNIDLDVELTSGLNVVIGGSSSGKTLFVDSLYRKIKGDFEETNYSNFEVESIQIDNPAGITPHYLSQNYIMSIVNNSSDGAIERIKIVKSVFPGDESIRDMVDSGLDELKNDLKTLIKCIRTIENESNKISRIPTIHNLITNEVIKQNLIDLFVPKESDFKKINYPETKYNEHIEALSEIDEFLIQNPLIEHDSELIQIINEKLKEAYTISGIELKIRRVISEEKRFQDESLKTDDLEAQTKKQHFEKLLTSIKEYSKAYLNFNSTLSSISEYSTSCESEEIKSMGHTLYIQNNFELNKDKFLEIVNHYLKTDKKIDRFEDIEPQKLFESNFKKQSPKVHDYDDFERKIYSKFEELNKKTYKIVTNDGRNFEDLSAGWKTSVILDLILGYEEDIAPIIIDQPEDNLATKYINDGLVKAIKRIKPKKQVILVSHNATIPMLADAQNIVLCRNINNKLILRSSRLEGEIDDVSILDYVADITDGGKPSVKKRVKKYNLKKFKS